MFYIVLISTTVMSWVELRQVKKDIGKTIDTSINAQIHAVYSTAASAAFAESEELAYNVVEGLAKYEAVKCAELELPDKTFDSGSGCSGEPEYSRLLVSWWSDAETLGRLNVYVDPDVAKEKFDAVLMGEIGRSLIYTLVVILGLTFFARRVVTSRIEGLSKKISKINFNEDFTLLEEGSDNDEIGNIARVINQLALYAQKHIISEKIQASKIHELSGQMKLVFEMAGSGIVITDKYLRLKNYNPRFKSWLQGVCSDEHLQLNRADWLKCFSDEPEEVKAQVLADRRYDMPALIELKATRKCDLGEKEQYYVLAYAKGRPDNAEETIVLHLRDQTESKRKLQKTEYEASHDSLTKLTNRLAATRHARHVFSSLDGSDSSALIFIDLDGFKEVNDTYGHDAGDELLRVVAFRLQSQIRKTDIAARWGGDEFMILLNQADAQEAMQVAKKLHCEILRPIYLESERVNDITVGASIGIAIANSSVSDFPTVLDYADQAMYDVKKTSKNGIRLYGDQKSFKKVNSPKG